MVLGVLLASPYFRPLHLAAAAVLVLVLRAFAQGRRTNRDRDLHARTVLITGGFTPLGLTVLQELAQRGAHVIALSPDPETAAILVPLLRTSTNNEHIFAEHCDLASPASIRAFCTSFLAAKDQRLDALIFAHEHQHIGAPALFSSGANDDQKQRDAGSLATFLLTTLLLPALLVAPAERDIRIVNVINPFYAAAAALPFSPSFSLSPANPKPTPTPIFLTEGRRALRTIVFTRHLQRILDALPSAAQVPLTEQGSTTVPVLASKIQKSNIVALTASPGIGRVHTVSRILNADFMSPTRSYLGLIIYIILQPLLRIFAKTPFAAIQSILHVLFLPTPFKVLSATATPAQGTLDDMPEEVLLPGALYADCAAVKLKLNVPAELAQKDSAANPNTKGKAKEKEGEKTMDIPDDGEYGGELAGRLVWEAYEAALKVWEQDNPADISPDPNATAPPPEVRPVSLKEMDDKEVNPIDYY